MKRKLFALALCLAVASQLLAQKKEDERLQNSAKVMQEIMSNNGLPKTVLDQAQCVLIFPGVKKIAIGIGGSYGRGAIVCRQGANMDGAWGAPAMYSLDAGSVGLQLGGSETDFVLVITSKKGVDQVLSGKTKLGSNASAAAGPTGAEATSFHAAAMKADVLTYSRSKGLFAGVSLAGASMETDNDANKAVYGKEVDARTIVTGGEQVPPSGEPLDSLLNKTSPTRKSS